MRVEEDIGDKCAGPLAGRPKMAAAAHYANALAL